MANHKSIAKNLLFYLFPTILFLTFSWKSLGNKTIAPLDLYGVSKDLYQSGGARQIENGFLTDIADQFLPWKYYLTQYNPKSCQSRGYGETDWLIDGILLPQGLCYPLGGSRPYTMRDSIRPLARVFSFFTAYNFSYFFSLCFLYFACFFFFREFLKRESDNNELNGVLSILGAILFSGSYIVARDLQADGMSQAIPYLLISLLFFSKSLRSNTVPFTLMSFFFLFYASVKSSIQILPFSFLFWTLFVIVWFYKELNGFTLKKWFSCIALGTLALLASLYVHWPSLTMFQALQSGYLIQSQESIVVITAKKLAALILSYGHFVFGDLIFAFDTVDFSKSIGNLGARDGTTYDYLTYFVNPWFGFAFTALVFQKIRTKEFDNVSRRLIWFLVIDVIVVLSPIYRIVYLRFHDWWMLTITILTLLSFCSRETKAINIKYCVPIFILGLTLMAGVVYIKFDYILAGLEGRGTFGFESGYWSWRMEKWLHRISLRDGYSWGYWLSAAFGGYFLWKKEFRKLVILSAVFALTLTTFRVNSFHSVNHFVRLQERLMNIENTIQDNAVPGRKMESNVFLFVNKPTPWIYESLGPNLNSLK